MVTIAVMWDEGADRSLGLPSYATEGAAGADLRANFPDRGEIVLAPGARVLVTMRDGAAVAELAAYLTGEGFGASALTVLEALGGPRERLRRVTAETYALSDVQHPVAVAIEVAGNGAVMGAASGRADEWFAHDGQITKRPVRALALSALAPRPGELLWDIGAGSGSIGIEWLLSHPSLRAIGFEGHPERAARARENARRLGVDRLVIAEGRAPEVLQDQPVGIYALSASIPGADPYEFPGATQWFVLSDLGLSTL